VTARAATGGQGRPAAGAAAREGRARARRPLPAR
jgi:hypothetical protein